MNKQGIDNINDKIKNFSKKIGTFLLKYLRFFLIAFVLFIISFGVYMWYSNLYNFEWSDEKKNEYIKTQNNRIKFNEEKFNKIIEEVKKRKENYLETKKTNRDIFFQK